MAKSRRKKNYKLKRRVMRTVAALTMIMAIVVAAIPVENYGTTQAASEDARSIEENFVMSNNNDDGVNEKDIYDLDNRSSSDTFNDIVQNHSLGSNEDKITQFFDGNHAEVVYTTVNSGDGLDRVVAKSDNTSAASLKINAKEYVNLRRISYSDMDNFANNFNGGFQISTGDDGGLSTIQYTDGTSASVAKLKLVYPSVSIAGLSINGFTIGGSGSVNVETALKACESTWTGNMNGLVAAIDAYNTSVTQITSNVNATDAEKQTLVNTYKALKQRTETLQYNQLTKSGNYPDIVKYIFCNYYTLTTPHTSGNLADCTLVEGTYTETSGDPATNVLFVKENNGEFIAEKQVNIVGIKKEAFKPDTNYNPQYQTITIPSSVKFIGNSAFEGCQALTSVEIDLGACEDIGDHAFDGCTNLGKVTFTGNSVLKTIGVRAFRGTNITETINLPGSIRKIGAGCFEGSKVPNVVFGADGDAAVTIGKYAFYNCARLSTVTFNETNNYDIQKGAFAMPDSSGTAEMTEFTFPIGTKNITDDPDHDYVLAARSGLKKVTFGGETLGGMIPANTLRGCYGLTNAYFNSPNVGYNSFDEKNQKRLDEQLFSDVREKTFMVEGPDASTSGSMAEARKSSQTGMLGYQLDDAEKSWAPVPYKFKGKNTIEIGFNEGKYVATADIHENGSDATLSKYKWNTVFTDDGKRIPITIPAQVGNYYIVAIGDGCFEGDVKKKVYELTISDGYIREIGDHAFEGCDNLEWVYIGNSVQTIGEYAFAKCKNLANVKFGLPGGNGNIGEDQWESQLAIGAYAFQTGSDYLTFHGAIHSGYAPFELAMSENNSTMTGSGRQICYKSDEPYNLTVMRNRSNEKATLIDYPHYDEIDVINEEYIRKNYLDKTTTSYSILDKYSDYINNPSGSTINDMDRAIGNAVFNIDLPSGIESIDSKSFYDAKSGNKDDFGYVQYQYIFEDKDTALSSGLMYKRKEIETETRSNKTDTNKDITRIYSEDEYPAPEKAYKEAYYPDKSNEAALTKVMPVGGLFSGWFNEEHTEVSSASVSALIGDEGTASYAQSGSDVVIGREHDGHKYIEVYKSGNDHLSSVSMSTVEELPDYAFDSNENLRVATFGAGLKKINSLPFRNCQNLYQINFENNNNFVFQNMMLYENTGNAENPQYKLKECLEGRGKQGDYYGIDIAADELLDNVTEIDNGAFSNCTNLRHIDLSKTRVEEIPDRCFDGDTSLTKIVFPDTVLRIGNSALTRLGTGKELTITVPNPNCTITADAIDGKNLVTIIAPKYLADGKTLSTVYRSYVSLVEKYGETDVKFGDEGNTYTVEFVDKDLHTISGYVHTLTVKLDENEGKGYDLNESQILKDAPEYDGLEFVTWQCRVNGETLTGTKAGDPIFSDIKEDRLFVPLYKPNPAKVVGDGSYRLSMSGGTATVIGTDGKVIGNVSDGGSLEVPGGSLVAIHAVDTASFKSWQVDPNAYTTLIDNASLSDTSFTMPNAAVTVIANAIGGNAPNPDGTYTVTVNNGTGGGNYRPGETVTITATTPTGQTFTNWTTTTAGVTLANANTATTTFVMPSSNVTVTANFSGGNTANPDGSYTVTVNNGTGGGNYQPGATVTITANTPPSGQTFANWTTTTTGVTLANANSNSTTFVMPASNVTVTANYSGGNQGGSSDDDNNKKKYKVTVNYGSGSGEYEAGATVNITANAPESSSRVFSRWTTSNSGIGFANANAVSTSFIMPASDVTVTANYKARTSDDDDDDDSTSRRPGTNTSTNTVTNRPGSSTNTTGTTGTVNNPTNGTSSGTTNNNNGNRIYITKNGISNTDVASLAVSGSTDNFIVRITESAEATAAVEQALTNTYGSLNGLAYLPMDISLYDATGQNKITDSTGLNITVTMPIPDVLIQYGGNARVAAADNGNLVQLTPRFTTIDGIACVSFVPPHFSPYVIYVDTNNLIAGQMLDATPATGDPIHPKWFAAIGMACVSVLLFVLSDGRKRKKYRAA